MNKALNYKKMYYLLTVLGILILPTIYLFIYNQYAGGLLNGLWGVYETGILDESRLVEIFYPLTSLVVYLMLVFVAFKMAKEKKIKLIDYILLSISTLVAIIVVSWSYIT